MRGPILLLNYLIRRATDQIRLMHAVCVASMEDYLLRIERVTTQQ